MFKQSNSCLSTAIYIDAVFWHCLMLFLKMSIGRKNFGVFIYIIFVYVGFLLHCCCCSKNLFVLSVTFRHYWTKTTTRKTTTTITTTTTTTTTTAAVAATTSFN
jgi:hypothetical protein